jgi:hypothetical protein
MYATAGPPVEWTGIALIMIKGNRVIWRGG